MWTIVRAMCIILYVWLIPANNMTDSKRILAIIVGPWYSHQVVHRSLFTALNKRGHELVVVTSNPIRDPTLKNYMEIELPNVSEIIEKFLINVQLWNISVDESIKLALECCNELNVAIFDDPKFVKYYRHDSNEKFDAVIVEAIAGIGLYAMAHRFNAPLIGETISANCMFYMMSFVSNVYK